MERGQKSHAAASRVHEPRTFAGESTRVAAGLRVAIVVARWNDRVTGGLLAGALDRFAEAGLSADAIDVAWVPGAFELPLVADRLAATGGYAAVVCLGAIIRGETEHDRHIAQAVARGIEAEARKIGAVASRHVGNPRIGPYARQGVDEAPDGSRVGTGVDRLPHGPTLTGAFKHRRGACLPDHDAVEFRRKPLEERRIAPTPRIA